MKGTSVFVALTGGLCALILVAFSFNTHAIEVQVGNRAQTMGMAFTAVADDPSAVFHNPAGLTQIKNTEIDVGLGLQFINLDYYDPNGVDHPLSEIIPVPTLFVSTDKVKPVVLGLGFYVPWGSKAEIDANAASGLGYQKSELTRYDLTMAVGYKLSDTVSLGIGFTTAYVTFKNDVPVGGGAARLDEDASGFGFGGVGGLLWNPHPRFKLGLSVRSPLKARLDGEATLAGTADNFSTDFNFPGTFSLGLAVVPIDILTVSFDFDWTNWSYLSSIVRDYDTLATTTQPINGKSAHDYRLGFEFRPFEKTHFRWGYSYQQAGWPKETIVPTQLEYPLHVVAVGASQFYKKVRIDLGYEFSFAVNRNVTGSVNGLNGNYDGIRQIILLNTGIMF